MEANDAMIALLIGGRLSKHLLSLMTGSEAFLTDVFPGLPDISKLNVTIPRAGLLLADSERHLAQMAIPYALSIHEDYLNSCIDMVLSARGESLEAVGWPDRKLSKIYKTLAGLGVSTPPSPDDGLFELVRLVRNQIVHEMGLKGHVVSYYMSNPQLADPWRVMAKRDIDTADDGVHLRVESNELFASLGVLKRLADWLNVSLQNTLPAQIWARICVESFKPIMKPGNDDQVIRKLWTHVRRNYGALQLSDDQITQEAATQGLISATSAKN